MATSSLIPRQSGVILEEGINKIEYGNLSKEWVLNDPR